MFSCPFILEQFQTDSILSVPNGANSTRSSFWQPLVWADTVNAEERNYCNDPALNLEWELLIKKYPEDMGLHALHALRLGLCIKVERDDISLDDAFRIFEDVKEAFVEEKLNKLLEDYDIRNGKP
jgi:hypothetical protein